MTWKITFEENGGHDGMSAAYAIYSSAHELIVVDGAEFKWHRSWDPAPPGTKERMLQVAEAIAEALNKLDNPVQ